MTKSILFIGKMFTKWYAIFVVSSMAYQNVHFEKKFWSTFGQKTFFDPFENFQFVLPYFKSICFMKQKKVSVLLTIKKPGENFFKAQ